jgi:3-oxoadipate enol-lactonase
MARADLAGVQIEYESIGSGPPLVWVGGTGIGGGVWKPHQVPHFADRFRCVVFDLRGTGASSAPECEYTVELLAGDLRGLLDHLEIESAHFVGVSLGSAILQELALADPERVDSLVLMSTWSSTRREHHIRNWFEARLGAVERAPRDVFGAFAFWMWAPSVIDFEPELVEEIQRILVANSSSQPVHAYAGHFRADLGHETHDRLSAIRCPTLVLYGSEDLITLPWYNRTVAKMIPGARLRQIGGAGHLAWLERPQEVNGAIDEFLSAVVSAGASTAGTGR